MPFLKWPSKNVFSIRLNCITKLSLILYIPLKTCNVCKQLGTPTNKHFKCHYCGSHMNAHQMASLNIATLGHAGVNPEESSTMCCAMGHM